MSVINPPTDPRPRTRRGTATIAESISRTLVECGRIANVCRTAGGVCFAVPALIIFRVWWQPKGASQAGGRGSLIPARSIHPSGASVKSIASRIYWKEPFAYMVIEEIELSALTVPSHAERNLLNEPAPVARRMRFPVMRAQRVTFTARHPRWMRSAGCRPLFSMRAMPCAEACSK
jgi:hypothetical protein